MKPLRIRIDRIVDFGTIVSLIGVDTETARPVTVHVDRRPFTSFWEVWREAGFPQPIEYAADRLLLHLNLLPDDDAGEVHLTECDGADAHSVASGDRRSLPEIER